jgi:hypothetical protein
MKKFIALIRSLTAVQILEVLLLAIDKPYTVLNMNTFGNIVVARQDLSGNYRNEYDPRCYGCAATNVICHLIHKPIPALFITDRLDRTRFLMMQEEGDPVVQTHDYDQLLSFENAIDVLRRGRIDNYNSFALRIGLAQMPEDLPLMEITDGILEADKQYVINNINQAIEYLKKHNNS